VTLMPLDRALAAARAQSRVVVVTLLFLLIGLLAWLFRQRERAASQQAVQRELECKVAERTADLEAVNRQLVIESSERAAADARYRQSREELAQVNRLGTLGQVTAGVAHEINQPLAAIRTFAENASRFLGQGKAEKTAENLTHIVRLTERIATITAELRNFARRRTPAIGATSLADAIEGSLLLVKHRITSSKVSIKWAKRAANLTVRADRIRLEQIFVNLIQNSLDALSGRSDGVIELAVRAQGDGVIVLVADNGPGLPPDLQATLFMPFSTGKGDGLGLGLAIVRDIARAFGGDIALVDGPGARFELRLVKA
jgi:two-component system, NtrC family, C4-dicarboxylate transport sensor histidine kinase DctB